MGFVVMFILGVIFGIIVTITYIRSKTIGDLRMDSSDPTEQPYMFMVLYNDMEDIYKSKYVTLKVNLNNFLSQK